MVRSLETLVRERLEPWTRFEDEVLPSLAGEEEWHECSVRGVKYRIGVRCAAAGPNGYQLLGEAIPAETAQGRTLCLEQIRHITKDATPTPAIDRILQRAELLARDDGEPRVRRYLAGCHGAFPESKAIAVRLALAYSAESNFDKAFRLIAEAGKFPAERTEIFHQLCQRLRRRSPVGGLIRCDTLCAKLAGKLSLEERLELSDLANRHIEERIETEEPVRWLVGGALFAAFVTWLALRQRETGLAMLAAITALGLAGSVIRKAAQRFFTKPLPFAKREE